MSAGAARSALGEDAETEAEEEGAFAAVQRCQDGVCAESAGAGGEYDAPGGQAGYSTGTISAWANRHLRDDEFAERIDAALTSNRSMQTGNECDG